MNNSKAFYKSKTFWTAIIIPAIVAFIPGAADWVKANPNAFGILSSALFIALRIITKGAVSLGDPPDVLAPSVKSTAIAIPLLLALSLPARAQVTNTSHAANAISQIGSGSSILASATAPDTIVLTAGGGLKGSFDSIPVPFGVRIAPNRKWWIAGQPIPRTPDTAAELFICSYVDGDTLVFSNRAQNGTFAQKWGAGSIVSFSNLPMLSYLGLHNGIFANLAADTSTTGQTLLGTPLQFAVGANQTWGWEVAVYDSSSSAAGIKFGVLLPASASVTALGGGVTSGPTAWTSDIITASATAGTAVATVAGYSEYQTQGTVTTGGTAGNVVFQFEKVTSGTAIVKAGSYLTAWRLK